MSVMLFSKLAAPGTLNYRVINNRFLNDILHTIAESRSQWPKIRFLGEKIWPVARAHTDRHTHRVTTVGTLSGFQDFFLQPIIKDWSNKHSNANVSMSINQVRLVGIWLLDRSLMIGWRKNSWNPERVSSVFTFVSVCLSVCLRATEHTFWPRNLIFGLKDPWDMRKKLNFLFFEILKNWIFRTISLSCLSVSELQRTPFGLGTWFLDWRVLGTWERNAFFLFFEILKNGIFRTNFHFRVCLCPRYRAHLLA